MNAWVVSFFFTDVYEKGELVLALTKVWWPGYVELVTKDNVGIKFFSRGDEL